MSRTAKHVSALATGLLFAFGLALSGMTQPSKVIGFFDFSRGLQSWDPSLAFVMGGGMLVYMPVYRLVRRRQRPLFEDRFRLPTRADVDLRLLAGSALFGIGWGLAGFCPGPALVSAGARSPDAIVLGLSMLAGMLLFQRLDALRAARRLGEDG